jgi:hypothetical protein
MCKALVSVVLTKCLLLECNQQRNGRVFPQGMGIPWERKEKKDTSDKAV